MNTKTANQTVILNTIGNATRFLTELTVKGCKNISSDASEKILQFSEAFRIWKFHRLALLFDKLSKQLVGIDENSMKHRKTSISQIISDAIFTCKAIKTSFKGRLTDYRVQNAIMGEGYKNTTFEKINDVTLLKVGEEFRMLNNKYRYIDKYYMEAEGRGTIYKTETRIEPLVAPAKATLSPNVTQSIVVEKAFYLTIFLQE